MVRWPPTDGQPGVKVAATPFELGNLAKTWRSLMCLRGGLTLKVSGGQRRHGRAGDSQPCPAVDRPLDRRVRPAVRDEIESPGERPRQRALKTFETLRRTWSHARF